MKRIVLILLLASIIPFSFTYAQGYTTALGVRLANGDDFRSGGISLQQRIFNKFTIEGIAQTDFSHNHTFHAMIQMHQNIITKSFNFYLGAGVCGGIEENNYTATLNGNTVTTTTFNNKTFGADLIAGLELSVLRFNISLDYKPNFNFYGREDWYQGQIALSLRYILFKGPVFDKKSKPKPKKQASGENPTLKDFFDDLFKKQ